MSTPNLEKKIIHFQEIHDDRSVHQFLAGNILNTHYRGGLDALFCEGIEATAEAVDIARYGLKYDGSNFMDFLYASSIPIFGVENKGLHQKQLELTVKLCDIEKCQRRLYGEIKFMLSKLNEHDISQDMLDRSNKLRSNLYLLLEEAEHVIRENKHVSKQRSEFMVEHMIDVAEKKKYRQIGIAAGQAHSEEIRSEAEKRGHVYVPIIPDTSHVDPSDRSYIDRIVTEYIKNNPGASLLGKA